jgi:hypothetical protein
LQVHSRALRAGSVPAVLLLLSLGCSSGGGDGDDDDQNIHLFTDSSDIKSATGSATVVVDSLLPTQEGHFLLNDASGAVVFIATSGNASLFTSEDQIRALTGGGTARLGPLDRIFSGSLAGQFIGADGVSGLMIRLALDGTPVVHSTEAQITMHTGAASARVSLPRALTTNQIIAQELVTGNVLLFANNGAVAAFATRDELALASGLAPAAAVVAAWVRGASTGTQFARFEGTANIVRVAVNSTVGRHVDAAELEALFPTIADLTVLDFVADTESDALLLLIGDGTRGVALAVVSSDGSMVEVFATRTALETVAGMAVDISDIDVFASGIPFAIDRAGDQVLVFEQENNPSIILSRQEIIDATETPTPAISKGVRIGSSAVIAPEEVSGDLTRS